ncbi:lipid droplet-regulating VLDL assembly factor AUP1 isoform X2 [Betta splendens]|uniref:Lipid droplet-regulating VLDL assembly factor AUP1 n=1 Tax=Betta splendens TaxID=158456 RepID=A0A9W2Y2T3_BETSP|nr:lipid droplet-regulating VLDL assembly factor AUP1 isoform X2 [Betta splendens]
METRGIEDMFDFRRLPKDAIVLLLLLIYFPVGICLMLIRIFIGIHVFLVSCALPESFVRSSWPFSLTDSIQPVALRVNRPLVALSTPECSWLMELLWTFFAPCTVYHVSWLPPVSRQDGESTQEFADKVQELLAGELSLVSTKITKADKAEHIKRKRHAIPQTSAGVRPGSIGLGFMVHNLGTDDHTIAKMAQQVKDVLPHIPLNVITKDLAKTNCVDTTITNLLENKEESSMEATGTSTFGSKLSSYSSGSAPTIKPAAKCFGKSPVDRHLSLQERKEALYNFARRRYIEKHGLDQGESH